MKKLSFKIAFGGIASALCVLLMFSAAVIPFMTYAFPMISGLLIYAVSYECGKKTGIAAYLSVSFLLLMLSPEKESAFMFAFFFGYYPMLSIYLDRLKSKALSWVIRLFIFNVAMAVSYFILLKLFIAADSEEFTKIGAVVLLIAGNFLVVLYDFLIRRLADKYVRVYRKKLFRRK